MRLRLETGDMRYQRWLVHTEQRRTCDFKTEGQTQLTTWSYIPYLLRTDQGAWTMFVPTQ